MKVGVSSIFRCWRIRWRCGKEIEELQSQAQALSQEGKSTDEVDSKRLTVQTKFMELLEPLNERKQNLLASKEIHQFNRDVRTRS